MKLTYRTRRRLRRLGITLLTLFLVALFTWVCWLIWLDRFVVYSRDGSARLDFSWELDREGAVPAVEPTRQTVTVKYNEGEDQINTSTELAPITGYCVTTADLKGDLSQVTGNLKALSADSAVMLTLKDGFGTFYYNSQASKGDLSSQVDLAAMDELIRDVTRGDNYSIARISAFRDRAFGLENTNYGLAHTSGAYLWADEENCYWLNPASNGTISYLIDVATELRELGFDEVVFTDFRFPDTENIIFDGDRSEAIAQAAEALVTACATNHFAVSFETDDESFVLPAGRSRLYLADVDAARVQPTAESIDVPDKMINLVFFTETNDTRFNDYSVIRPMPAQVQPEE